MIWGHRRTTLPVLGASIETATLIDIEHRFHMFRLEGVIDDTLLHQPVFPTDNLTVNPALSVILRGRTLIRAGAERRWIERGEGYVMHSGSNLGWRIEAGCHAFTFVWNSAIAKPPADTFFQLDAQHCDALERAADLAYAGVGHAGAESVHAGAMAALESAGVIPTRTFARTGCEPEYQTLVMAVDQRLSNLAEEPMQIELQEELGISERQLRRLTTEMFKRYAFVDSNWAEARVRRRLTTAVAFMSNPRATVSQVARGVGYHSTQAMARAFSRAGFPAPGRIREVLTELASR